MRLQLRDLSRIGSGGSGSLLELGDAASQLLQLELLLGDRLGLAFELFHAFAELRCLGLGCARLLLVTSPGTHLAGAGTEPGNLFLPVRPDEGHDRHHQTQDRHDGERDLHLLPRMRRGVHHERVVVVDLYDPVHVRLVGVPERDERREQCGGLRRGRSITRERLVHDRADHIAAQRGAEGRIVRLGDADLGRIVGREDEQAVRIPNPDTDDALIVEESVLQRRQELVVSRTFDRPSDPLGVERACEHVLRESDRTLLRSVSLALQPLRLLLARHHDGDEADDREDRPEEEADPVAGASIGLHVCLPTSLGNDNIGPAMPALPFPSASARRV